MTFLDRVKKNWFSIAVLLLGLFLVVNLFGGLDNLYRSWKAKTDNSLVTDDAKWRSWLNQNRELFASLRDGAQVGITKNLEDNYGLVWTKQPNEITVTRTDELRKIGPGIILEFDDEVAKDLLWKKNREEAIIFLRHRSQIGKVETYHLKKEDKLKAEGFVAFLRDLGLRPS